MIERWPDKPWLAAESDSVHKTLRQLADCDAAADEVVQEIMTVIPASETFMLIDEKYLQVDSVVADRKYFRFEYTWYGPATEERLLDQFNRFRRSGAEFVVVAWPALWWLTHYRELNERIQAISNRVHAGDGYVVFDLRPDGAKKGQQPTGFKEIRDQASEDIQKQNPPPIRDVSFTAALLCQVSHLKEEVSASQRMVAKLSRTIMSLRKDLDETKRQSHSEWLFRVDAIVRRTVSADVILMVVSRGDDELLSLGATRGWHFPQMPDGTHAGSPADSQEILERLAEGQAKGATHLLIPGWSAWWLEFYAGLRLHLDRSCTLVWRDTDCILYDLNAGARIGSCPPESRLGE